MPSPPPPARTGPPTLRPRTSVTCEGSSLASLRNRIAVSYPGTGTLIPGMSRSHRSGAISVVLAATLVIVLGTLPAARAPAARATPAVPSTPELVGQRLVVAMSGQRASPALLGRIRRGEIGGVILFGFNIAGPTQLQRLTAQLQAAAQAAGRPPLLIATDQEGGDVRRLRWAGPAA